MAVTFSVVIATYGRPGPLTECLDSIYRQSYPPMEVIVVGVEEDRGTRQAVERFRRERDYDFSACELKFMVSPEKGAVVQRNLGIRETRGEWVCFFDDDCVLDPGYLSAMERFYRANGNRNIVGMLGLIRNEMDGRFNTVLGILSRMTFFRMMVAIVLKQQLRKQGRCAVLEPQFNALRNPVRVLVAPSGNIVYSRSFIVRELFDSFFKGYALGEDVELSVRALKYGDIYYIPQAGMVHKHVAMARESVFSVGRKQIVNLLYIYRKHFTGYHLRGIVSLISVLVYSLMVSLLLFVRKPWELSRRQELAGILWGLLSGVVDGSSFRRGGRRQGDGKEAA